MVTNLYRWFRHFVRDLRGEVDIESEHVTELSTRAHFPVDELLERRIKAAREVMGTIEPKPVRKKS